MNIAILGAGAWGTALAVSACRATGSGRVVSLWVRDPAQAELLSSLRVNDRYLPGITLLPGLSIRTGSPQFQEADLVVVATPVAALRTQLVSLQECQVPVVWLCKGFEPASGGNFGLMAHEVQASVAPNVATGVLSGPSFAQEVARGQPTALVAASGQARVCELLVRAFHGPVLRIYASDDLVGVEVGGAVKNVLAIATGLCDGLQLGMNARAALISRGLSEMTRLGVALGARPETFMGLSGLGDLVLTATGDLSRNRQVGLALARGQTLAQAVQSLGHVAEGVFCARTVVQRATHLGVDMPIARSVVELLDGQVTPAQAVSNLMGREARVEI